MELNYLNKFNCSRPRTTRLRTLIKNSKWPPYKTKHVRLRYSLIFYSYSKLMWRLPVYDVLFHKGIVKGAIIVRESPAPPNKQWTFRFNTSGCGFITVVDLSCKHDQLKLRYYIERWATSPTWGPPPSRKHALKMFPTVAYRGGLARLQGKPFWGFR